MSQAKLQTNKYGTPGVLVNGRHFYLDAITGVAKVNDYTWDVTHQNGDVFRVWGGKKSGGAKNQWFIDDLKTGREFCKGTVVGLVDALKLLNGM